MLIYSIYAERNCPSCEGDGVVLDKDMNGYAVCSCVPSDVVRKLEAARKKEAVVDG